MRLGSPSGPVHTVRMIRRYQLPLVAAAVGAVGGFAYYCFIGCHCS